MLNRRVTGRRRALFACHFRRGSGKKMEASGVGTNGPLPAPKKAVSSTPGPPPPPAPARAEQQSSLTELIQMWLKFGQTFAVIFPIYVLGYFEFSFSWVLVGLAMLFYWRKNHGHKDYRINRALKYLEHEDQALKQSVPTTDLPPWVSLAFLTPFLPPSSSLRPGFRHFLRVPAG